MTDTKKPEPDRFGIFVWSLFGCVIGYALLKKYGLLLTYLKASAYLYLFISIYVAYWVSGKVDFKQMPWFRFLKSVIAVGTFFAMSYLLFFLQIDLLLIAAFKDIPIEALSPCSNLPLNQDAEQIARGIFKLREIDNFYDTCKSYSD